MPAHKFNWPEAEQAYIQAPDRYPQTSLKDISERFNIPYQTLRRYAAKHKWNSRRCQMNYEARRKNDPPPRTYEISTRGMPKSMKALYQKIANENHSGT